MIFPKKLILQDSMYALDGGTTTLLFTDEQGKEHTVVLNQYAYIPDSIYFDKGLPGRLYFNESLIEIRSSQENSLLDLLKSAELRNKKNFDLPGERNEFPSNVHVFGDDLKKIFNQNPEENLQWMLKNVIDFVESDKYISFAEEVNQKLKSQH